jgi:hypothetical protein
MFSIYSRSTCSCVGSGKPTTELLLSRYVRPVIIFKKYIKLSTAYIYLYVYDYMCLLLKKHVRTWMAQILKIKGEVKGTFGWFMIWIGDYGDRRWNIIKYYLGIFVASTLPCGQ